MKTPLFFLAAFAAFFALPYDFTTMASLLFGAGILAILISDYRRTYRSMSASRNPVTPSRQHHLRLAA